MHHRFASLSRILLAALAVMLAGSFLNLPAASAATRSVSPFGMSAHLLWGNSNADIDHELDLLAAAGASRVRVDVSWRDIETADNTYNTAVLTSLDHVISAASSRGISVLPVIIEFPDWANGGTGMWGPPTDDSKFGDFARYMAARYAGRITYWELGNEVNEREFWDIARSASPSRYTQFLQKGYAGIKQGNPSAMVISAGLAGSDDGYLQEMYDAGAKDYFDILGVHAYTLGRSPFATDQNTPSSTFDGLAIMKATMDRNGDSTKKIWITEAGWQTSNVDYHVTQAQQAQFIYEAFQRLYESFPYVETLFTYGLRNNGTNANVATDNYGLMSNSYAPKPAYAAYRRAYETFAQVPAPVVTLVDPTSTITIKRSAAGVYLPKPFVLSGVLGRSRIGDLVVVYVKKPGKAYWSYSSARLVYAAAGDWWYRYTPMLRGLYQFQVKFAGNASMAAASSPIVGVAIR